MDVFFHTVLWCWFVFLFLILPTLLTENLLLFFFFTEKWVSSQLFFYFDRERTNKGNDKSFLSDVTFQWMTSKSTYTKSLQTQTTVTPVTCSINHVSTVKTAARASWNGSDTLNLCCVRKLLPPTLNHQRNGGNTHTHTGILLKLWAIWRLKLEKCICINAK